MNDINLLDYLDDENIRQNKSWDYNLDYKNTYQMLLKDIEDLRSQFKLGNITINRVKAFTNLIVGLIELRNGSRIGEAVEAVTIFCEENSRRVVQVEVQKTTKIAYRKMVLPDEISRDDLDMIKSYVEARSENKKVFVISLCRYFQKHYNFSTHALRYSWIGYMALINTPPQLIAKITGHETLNLILHYTQKKVADRILITMSPG